MCSPIAQYRSIRAVFTAASARRRASAISPNTTSKSAGDGPFAAFPFAAPLVGRFGVWLMVPPGFGSGGRPDRTLLWRTPSPNGTTDMPRLGLLVALLVPLPASAKLEVRNVQ